MNRRSFIKALGVLAATPALAKYLNVFKSAPIREGIAKGTSMGMDFFNSVIKKVMDEGTQVGEADRIATFKHPDRADILVEIDKGTGDTTVLFEADSGTKSMMQKTSVADETTQGRTFSDIFEAEEVYGPMGREEQEGITGGITNLEEFIKNKKKFASGGRVGRWMGGPMSVGKSTLREMLRHFSKGSSHGKSGAEMLKMVNPKQFLKYLEDPNLFMKGSSEEGLMATDIVKNYVKKVESERSMMIGELLEAAKNIRKADKSMDQYRQEIIKEMMAKGADRKMAENLAEMVSGMAEGVAGKTPTPNITDQGLLELENIQKNLLTKGRALNADGGRVELAKGGLPRALQAALKAIRSKFGDDSIKTVTEDQAYGLPFANIPTPEKSIVRNKMQNFGKPGKFDEDGNIDYDYYADILNDSENTFVTGDETIEELEFILKEHNAEMEYMYNQYKMGKLDPEPGSKSLARKKILEKRLEEAEDSGRSQIMSMADRDELAAFGDDIDISQGMIDLDELNFTKNAEAAKLRKEFPGISDDLIKQILFDDNPQRIAEVKQTMREGLKMQEMGKGDDEILQILKNIKRTKQAHGGIIGLTNNPRSANNKAGVETLFKGR